MSLLLCRSYKHTNADAPDCQGGPMFIKNKDSGDMKIPYTYSIAFVVGHPLMRSPAERLTAQMSSSVT